MHPTICTIGPFTIYSYGLMLATAVFLCSFLASRRARFFGIPQDIIFDLTFWVVLSGLVGARILYILLNLPFFMTNPLETIMIQKGGLSWLGGLIAGSTVGLLFIKRKKLSGKIILDFCSPYLALGQAIGRIGCFFNGCCYGKEVSLGIYFPVHQARLHPTQLYEFLGLLVIFFILKNQHSKSKVQGSTFLLYLILAALLRFVIEFFRADQLWTAGGLSLNQWISLILIVGSVCLNRFLKSKHSKKM